MRTARDIIYKICAAPLGQGGRYHAWPDKITYVRRFPTPLRRDSYWRRYVVPKASGQRGLAYQVVMVDEWSGGWEFASEPVYADWPLISRIGKSHDGPIVEVG